MWNCLPWATPSRRVWSSARSESTKSVSPLFMAVAGTIKAVNEALVDAPEKVNQDPLRRRLAHRNRIRRGRERTAGCRGIQGASGDPVTHSVISPTPRKTKRRMLGVVGAEQGGRTFLPPSRRDCRHEGALPLTAMTEWELTAQAEALAASTPAAGSAWILGAGGYAAPHPRRCPGPCRPFRILHRLHAVPAGNQPGYAAGHLLNSRRSSPVCSAWKWPTPPCTTARPRWPKVR